MTPENFCYWLQGFFELTGQDKGLSPRQYDVIESHLNLVFDKITPKYDLNTPHTGDWNKPLCGTGDVDPQIYLPSTISTVPHDKTYC